mmetsp:Transcript_15788/g.20604  ORF Transcript_15788/g.20604 Transcript_15788/m.20604 type:complete len:151 (+) Transcript_15788:100-552(+)
MLDMTTRFDRLPIETRKGGRVASSPCTSAMVKMMITILASWTTTTAIFGASAAHAAGNNDITTGTAVPPHMHLSESLRNAIGNTNSKQGRTTSSLLLYDAPLIPLDLSRDVITGQAVVKEAAADAEQKITLQQAAAGGVGSVVFVVRRPG